MNISSMLDENAPRKGGKKASLQDLRWLDSGLNQPGNPSFDPTGEIGTQDNDVKPALQMEWGYGGISPLFVDQSPGAAKRTVPDETKEDTGPVILFARDQMNRGVAGKRLVAALKRKFNAELLLAAKGGLRNQFSMEGIAGCIAVDSRGYKSCKDALRAASASPFKRFIKHIIGCNCGTPHRLPGRFAGEAVVESSGNAIDDFVNQESGHKVVSVDHCQSTMLPILAGRGDLDQSEMDQTLIDLMNVTELPVGMVAEVRKAKASNLKRVQMAFRKLISLRDRKDAQKYQGKADTAGFVVDTVDRPVDLIDIPHAEEVMVDLNRRNNSIMKLDSAEQMDIEPGEDGFTAELQISSEVPTLKSLNVDASPAGVRAEADKLSDQEVEMETFRESEFEDVPELDATARDVMPEEVEVDLRQDMVI